MIFKEAMTLFEVKKKEDAVSLPFGGLKAKFEVEELINYYKSKNIDYLIIGAIHVTLVNHKKTTLT